VLLPTTLIDLLAQFSMSQYFSNANVQLQIIRLVNLQCVMCCRWVVPQW